MGCGNGSVTIVIDEEDNHKPIEIITSCSNCGDYTILDFVAIVEDLVKDKNIFPDSDDDD